MGSGRSRALFRGRAPEFSGVRSLRVPRSAGDGVDAAPSVTGSGHNGGGNQGLGHWETPA
ncbi:hypothetical protein GCM10027054_27810 [Isoptericola nanjingensis]